MTTVIDPPTGLASGRLTFGQQSLWRDIQTLPRERWYEANHACVITFPEPVARSRVSAAALRLDARHHSLRTVLDLADIEDPRQVLLSPLESLDLRVVALPPHRVPALVDELRRVPFDLRTERPWSLVAITGPQTRPGPDDPADPLVEAVIFSQHHLALDSWSVELFSRELLALVAGTAELDETSGNLVEVAHEQRTSPVWAAKQAATQRHLAKVYTTRAASYLDLDPAAGSHLLSLTSTRLLDACRALSGAFGVSIGTVITTAAADALVPFVDDRPIVFGLMSSNRFAVRWQHLVTSMNQWVHVAMPPVDASFSEAAQAVQQRSMVAYRLGIYDVDLLRTVVPHEQAAEASTRPTFTVNTYEVAPFADEAGDFQDGGAIRNDPVFTSAGPRSFLRVMISPDAVRLQLRTTGLPARVPEALIRTVHARIVHEAAVLAEQGSQP